MKAVTASAIVLLMLMISFAAATNGRCKFPAIFNFGDSNSDTGGFWAAFPAQRGPFGMTYFKKPVGRATDGRLVVDFLAQALGLPFVSPYLKSIGSDFRHGANFATLASTVMLPETSLFVTGVSPFSLAIQLNQMKELRERALQIDGKGKLPAASVFNEALYTIDIGQNDFTANLGAIGQDLSQVASQIAWTIKDLYDIGGRTFFVMNLAPVGCYPAFIHDHDKSDIDTYGCMISYNKAVVDYNNLLKETLGQIRGQLKDASVIYVDTHSVKLDLYQRPKEHGLLYGTKACCGYGGGETNYNHQLYCGNSKVINGVNSTATACSDPENYVSWDGIHTSDAANKLVTLAIVEGTRFDPPFPLSKLCDLRPIGNFLNKIKCGQKSTAHEKS